ncbi:hypothetical protein CLD22_30745 [Rubrivivax gelatinosus]|nr:hypothetical protein [Rubrivivax gelatinosus]
MRLCIGAPSSPLLSNSVMFDFDRRLMDFAAHDQITYTRYADDLSLSARTSGALNAYPKLVAELTESLEYPKLALNTKKTVFASRAGRRIITGVTLTSDHQISIGRARKREIRAMHHRMTMDQLNLDEQKRLAGLISFAEDIEPGFSAWLTKTTEA